MFRRILLTLTFVTALGAAGLGMTSTADARHGCHRSGYGGYGGYGGGYNAYYAPSYGYYPPAVYRASYYPATYYYGAPVYGGHHGHCHDDGGVYISLGF